MREIKFRAWDILAKKILNWGDIFVFPAWEIFPGTPEQRPYELMQYTGLKDKNGIEIYEGDIVRAKLINVLDFIIVFEKGRFTMKMILGRGTSADDQRWILSEDCEVIGNIYENPELLETKKSS